MSEKSTLLQRLLAAHPDTPKTRAKEWIETGRVTLNGKIVRRPHHEVTNPDDKVELLSRHAAGPEFGGGWRIHPRVTLLYLDNTLAILNKGAGVLSVPAKGDQLSALSILHDYLAGRLKTRDPKIASLALPPAWRRLTPLPVHRLDQFTSGVFCVAMNPDAREHLIQQVRSHTMKRKYLAFAEGCPSTPKGTWRHMLELSRDEFTQQVRDPSAEGPDPTATEAITHYEVVRQFPVIADFECVSELRLELETGLRHQIRVQAEAAGFPLIGDRKYNPHYRPAARPVIEFSRQALHAERLTLEHPEKRGQILDWRAPMPADLQDLQKVLRTSATSSPE